MPGQCWDEAVTWLHTVEMGKMDEIWSIKLYPFLEKLLKIPLFVQNRPGQASNDEL